MIAQFLYKNPRILFLVIGVVLTAGISAFLVMPRLEDPVLGKRVAVISTVFPGADARRVESLITVRLEEALRGISDIKQVRSSSRTGISNIIVELRDDVDDVDSVWSLVSDRIDNARSDLPQSSRAPEIEVFPLKAFAAIVALKPKDPQQPDFGILRRLARQLRTELTNIPGTDAVSVFGDPGEEFVVEVSPQSLASLNLTTGAIAKQVSANNVTQPAGFVRSADSDLPLDINAALKTVAHLEASTIRFGPNGESCNLSEVATISKRVVEPAGNWAIIDGEVSIVLGALVEDRLRVDQWTAQMKRVLAVFQKRFASETDAEVIFSQSDYIEARLRKLLGNLLIGTGSVIVVVFLLMGWRSMIVVGTTLPLSALMVLGGMRAMGIPIHQMSVTGLIVALGLLIDNAIVIVEEIRGRVFAGESATRAIAGGVRQLAMPLFGSTLTTTLAFLPIATLPGPPGEFVGTIAVSVILAISSSFLLAMTVVPALLSLMHIDPARRGFANYGMTNKLLKRWYEKSLDLVFRFPVAGVVLAAALPLWGYTVAGKLPEQFFPPSDRNQIQIEVELPARESVAKTLATINTMRATIAAQPQVKRVHCFVGGSAPTFYYNVVPRRRGTPFYGQAIVDLKSDVNAERIVRELQEKLDDAHGECRVLVRQLQQGPPFDAPIEARVVGPDLQVLHELGSRLRLILSQTPDVIHTRSDSEETIPKLIVNADAQSATRAGLSQAEIAQQLYTTLEGASAGNILVGEEELPVRVKMATRADSRLDQLGGLQIQPSRRGGGRDLNSRPPKTGPPLSAIADLDLGADMAAIVRINGKRTNEVKAYIRAGVLPSVVVAEFNRRLEAEGIELPDGYALEFGGEKAQRTNAIESLIANAVVLFSLMILTLVVSFRSFRHAAIIVAVGGLTIGLGPLALWLFGFPFGFMAIVGTMGLVGVAINDSIVVLAAIREHEPATAGDPSELRKVVVASTRHIIATTLTTIVGFLPLIIGGGGFWPPLAITIAGGVGGATFLALYFVPSMHLLLRRRQDLSLSGGPASLGGISNRSKGP